MQPSDKWRKALVETLTRLQTNTTGRCGAAGYSPKQILQQLLLIVRAESRRGSLRNLSLQLRAALKRAVGEGLLKLRAGRYTLATAAAAAAAIVVVGKNKTPHSQQQQQREKQRPIPTVNDSLLTKTTTIKSKINGSNKKKTTATVKKLGKSKKKSRSKR